MDPQSLWVSIRRHGPMTWMIDDFLGVAPFYLGTPYYTSWKNSSIIPSKQNPIFLELHKLLHLIANRPLEWDNPE